MSFRKRQQIADGSQDDGRVEQDQAVGPRADGGILARFIESVDGTGAGRHMAPGGTAASRDACGIDAQPLGIGSNPTDGRFSVGHALLGLCAVA